jgi:hypothetical protein
MENKMKDYIEVDNKEYKGVHYKINSAKIVEKEDNHYLEFDYDVKGLDEDDEKVVLQFEQFLGNLLIEQLEESFKDMD